MTIYTIGHSNIRLDEFIKLLKKAGIEVLVDVRSKPYSRYANQFNKDNLMKAVEENDIKYLYMGDALGGIPRYKEFYVNGRIDYDLIRQSNLFKDGIDRLIKGIKQYCVAIMCAEENPMNCHRRNLISKYLHAKGIEILHIRGDGGIERDDFCEDKKNQLQGILFN